MASSTVCSGRQKTNVENLEHAAGGLARWIIGVGDVPGDNAGSLSMVLR